MDAESQRVLEYLTDVEEAAEDVLTSKQQVSKYLVKTFKCKARPLGRTDISANGTVLSILAAKLTSLNVDSWFAVCLFSLHL